MLDIIKKYYESEFISAELDDNDPTHWLEFRTDYKNDYVVSLHVWEFKLTNNLEINIRVIDDLRGEFICNNRMRYDLDNMNPFEIVKTIEDRMEDCLQLKKQYETMLSLTELQK